ncbi:uncharacterized protein YndB with AHSA1/START domain [Deinococcus metalli]|uniref:Activator of HSP90 ATPase n=1 Tax=Deinococcus metalli TaxID=1141878 RepID=A0A7W8KCH5_9DEIO|nr:SRPBCC family protein [Deinococcus metalli]MBB5375672.1 uncharacterized protein YndB with AHSA1/START domain [Deinococcus metalli]GHF37899.1 activator of HSP90 ATPase [Deinococcus metalli]
MDGSAITVDTLVHAPLNTVWIAWTGPEHITQWNHASDDWHCPRAVNDLRPGGTFSSTMAARDGSVEFEFGGEYTAVQPRERLAYTIGDGRAVLVTFEAVDDDTTRVTETFEAESQHPPDMQRAGWQAILENFRTYAESLDTPATAP